MYERFSRSARQVIQLACQEAFRFNHHYTLGGRDTLHCLLSILKVRWCGASGLLAHLLGDVARLQSEVEAALAALPSEEGAFMGHLGLTPALRQAVEQAITQAKQLSAEYVGTEHLLLGLATAINDPAARLLNEAGVQHEHVHDHLWVLDFDSPSHIQSVAVLTEWRDQRTRCGDWAVAADDAIEVALEMALHWSGPGGCRCDKGWDLLEVALRQVFDHLDRRPNKTLHLTGPALRRFVSQRLSGRAGR